MLLSYHELCELVKDGVIDADPDNINGASIDVRLAAEIMVEKWQPEFNTVVNLSNKESPAMTPVTMNEGCFILKAGQFILASTQEIFNLPNDICCQFKLKSSVARAGLNNMLATLCDPMWTNSRLTLELKNDLQHHSLMLKPGMKIGQMTFYRVHPVPYEKSYAVNGRYNNTTSTTMSNGV